MYPQIIIINILITYITVQNCLFCQSDSNIKYCISVDMKLCKGFETSLTAILYFAPFLSIKPFLNNRNRFSIQENHSFDTKYVKIK